MINTAVKVIMKQRTPVTKGIQLLEKVPQNNKNSLNTKNQKNNQTLWERNPF